ncbi:hypothetical protein QFC22_001790 [Naganishia vaughanmartiniae]|uniref:Uncharacterized protein n=1 Tax=Naganishia vaughanmartiniae TaxID=1424756 RepID=A0ACC2XEX3_9TREE|nr:hypothetical protein QFC22_001790 [Naganishia vaughanmartiniae]
MHLVLAPSAQRPQGLAPNPLDVNSARAIDTSNRNGYTSDSLPSAAEPALLPSGFGHIPPPSVSGQQMQWALVPVWRPDANEQLPSQLTAPMPGFGSSRMMPSQFPSLNIQPMDPTTVYHPVPSYQQGSMGYPFSTTVPTGFSHNSLQLQQANSHTAADTRGYATHQIQHHAYGMAGATDISAMPHPFPVSAGGQMTGQESMHVDSAFYFSNRNGTEQPSAYPLESSSTGTSFSSQGYSNPAPMQACGSSVGSPPYTPLPQSTISGYSAIGHDMFRQQQEDMKHVYAPAVMMHMPPETPALASPIKRHNLIPEQTGMVGLGIMMPGM